MFNANARNWSFFSSILYIFLNLDIQQYCLSDLRLDHPVYQIKVSSDTQCPSFPSSTSTTTRPVRPDGCGARGHPVK